MRQSGWRRSDRPLPMPRPRPTWSGRGRAGGPMSRSAVITRGRCGRTAEGRRASERRVRVPRRRSVHSMALIIRRGSSRASTRGAVATHAAFVGAPRLATVPAPVSQNRGCYRTRDRIARHSQVIRMGDVLRSTGMRGGGAHPPLRQSRTLPSSHSMTSPLRTYRSRRSRKQPCSGLSSSAFRAMRPAAGRGRGDG